jgi:hypothetical protein
MTRRILGILAFLILVAVGVNVCDDGCSKNVSADETAGMAERYQQVDFKSGITGGER